MFRIATLVATLTLPILTAERGIGAAQLQFHYEAAEFANVVYNVACLARHIPCTRPAFEQFWHVNLEWNPDDQAELDAWIETVNRASGDADLPHVPFMANYGAFYPSVASRERFIGIAAEARTPEQFLRRIEPLTTRQDAARIKKMLEHFQRRFHSWWSVTGAKLVQTHIREVEQHIRSDQMTTLARQIAAFVEARLETQEVYLYAIARPDPKSKDSNATVVSNHFFVEVLAADTPDDTEWKAMHELTHYFYGTAPLAKHVGLMREFLQTNKSDAPLLYAFLNEALATAVQLLVYERKKIPDTDPYHHPYIPRLARSTLPLLKQALATGGTAFSGFSERYIRAGEVELGDELTSPKFLLSGVALLASERNEKTVVDAFVKEFQPRFSCGEKELQYFSDWNAIRFLTYDEAPTLAESFLTDTANTNHRGFAYAVKRGAEARIYFLAGRDTDAIIDVVKRLASLKSVAQEGLLFRVD